MSANASLTIVGGPQRIEPGRETTLTAQIINLGTVPDDFRLSVREIDPGWVTFRPPTIFLQPGDQANAAIVITPPVGSPAGSLRPIFRLLSRRAGNVAIVEIAMPTARAAAPPPYQPPHQSAYQPPARPQTHPPTRRQTPPPPPPPPPETTRPLPRPTEPTTAPGRGTPEPEASITEVIQQPRDVTPPRPEQRRTEPAVAPPQRRTVVPMLLGLGAVLFVLLLIVAGIALSRRAATVRNAEPTAAIDVAATEAPPASTAAMIVAAPAAASATATAAFVAKTFIVANTGGDGVYLRRTTNLDDRDTPYADGTQLIQIGPDVQANGTTWHHIRTPDGKIGYVPAQYTQQAP